MPSMPALATRTCWRRAAAAGMPRAGPPCRHAAHGDRSCAGRLLACQGRPACGHGAPGAVAAGSASSSGMHTCAHSGRCQPHDQCRKQQGCQLHPVEGRVRPPDSLSRSRTEHTIGPACRTARKLPLRAGAPPRSRARPRSRPWWPVRHRPSSSSSGTASRVPETPSSPPWLTAIRRRMSSALSCGSPSPGSWSRPGASTACRRCQKKGRGQTDPELLRAVAVTARYRTSAGLNRFSDRGVNRLSEARDGRPIHDRLGGGTASSSGLSRLC
jgi:hypothetical protein